MGRNGRKEPVVCTHTGTQYLAVPVPLEIDGSEKDSLLHVLDEEHNDDSWDILVDQERCIPKPRNEEIIERRLDKSILDLKISTSSAQLPKNKPHFHMINNWELKK